MSYKLINNLLGWLMFVIAMVVYSMTLEPSVSLWDCGEFISASAKLQVVHPPGAPLFLMMGRLFTMFASTPQQIAVAVNMLSATCSAMTVLFTFWITTHFARKMAKGDADSTGSRLAIFGSGVVAALALTFTDSFWFSAVEAEVYAMASFLTAITFWAGLRWEESNSKYADKWLVMIAYLIGLSIGAHLLSLLVIPAVTLIYYFKNYKYSGKGLFISFLIGMAILFFVQNGIIPGIPTLMSQMDLYFVNSLGFGFNTGCIFAIVLLIAIAGGGIYYFTKVNVNRFASLGFICLAYIMLGYSSYAMVVIRSIDNPPIDMNNPEEPFNLLSYVNREQYGDRPLLYGPYFNAQPSDIAEKGMKYRKDKDKYTALGREKEYVYDKEDKVFFPRMGDMNKDGAEQGYRSWGGMGDITDQIDELQRRAQQSDDPKEREDLTQQMRELKLQKPRMANNIQFLVSYQLGHMYWRYFMWNFAGRQNDQQGHDFNRYIEGNWISGVKFLDAMRLGPQSGLPDYMEQNQARNKYYFIPLILGILGFIYHYKRGKNDAIVTACLFIFTGVLIIIFLNQPPYEPRERDYSLVGSFQTFCIWIGLGVLFIWDKLKSRMNTTSAAVLAAVVSLSGPLLMGSQGWDDHDRSKRYLGIDFAKDYLNSCPPNAILFTNGDNDTYPLWYAQNVEGIRTDVRIINQSLLPTDWYSQVLLTKVYKSNPLPLTLTKDQLAAGNNEYFQFSSTKAGPMDLKTVIKGLLIPGTEYYPTNKFTVPVNKEAVLREGVVSIKDSADIASEIVIDFPRRGLNKGDLVLLDLIATNAERGWKRPICFTTTSGSEGFMNMEPYFERRGLVFQLIPVRTPTSTRNNVNRVNDEVLYNNLMNVYKYSGMSEKKHFFLDDKAAIVPSNLRTLFVSLCGFYLQKIDAVEAADSALALPESKEKINEYKTRIMALLTKCKKVIPESVLVTKDNVRYGIAEVYHEIGEEKLALEELTALYTISKQEVDYYLKFSGRTKTYYLRGLAKDSYDMMTRCANAAKAWNNPDTYLKWSKINKDMESSVNSFVNLD